MKIKTYVLDSFAFFAYNNEEKGANIVEQLLNNAEQGAVDLFLHRINWGEIYYKTYRDSALNGAEKTRKQIDKLPITIVDDASEEFVRSTAIWKGKHLIAYANAFAINLALLKESPLVTGDPEILKLSEYERNLEIIRL